MSEDQDYAENNKSIQYLIQDVHSNPDDNSPELRSIVNVYDHLLNNVQFANELGIQPESILLLTETFNQGGLSFNIPFSANLQNENERKLFVLKVVSEASPSTDIQALRQETLSYRVIQRIEERIGRSLPFPRFFGSNNISNYDSFFGVPDRAVINTGFRYNLIEFIEGGNLDNAVRTEGSDYNSIFNKMDGVANILDDLDDLGLNLQDFKLKNAMASNIIIDPTPIIFNHLIVNNYDPDFINDAKDILQITNRVDFSTLLSPAVNSIYSTAPDSFIGSGHTEFTDHFEDIDEEYAIEQEYEHARGVMYSTFATEIVGSILKINPYEHVQSSVEFFRRNILGDNFTNIESDPFFIREVSSLWKNIFERGRRDSKILEDELDEAIRDSSARRIAGEVMDGFNLELEFCERLREWLLVACAPFPQSTFDSFKDMIQDFKAFYQDNDEMFDKIRQIQEAK